MWRKKAVWLWRTRALLGTAALFLLTVPLALRIRELWLVSTLLAGGGVLVCGYLPLYLNAFSLEILADRILLHSGAFIRKTCLLPAQDQIFVTIHTTPAERMLHLCRARIYGRGRVIHILCLPRETAEQLERRTAEGAP